MRIGIRFRLALQCTLSIVAVVVAVTILQVYETHRSASEALGKSQFALVTARANAIDREFDLRIRALERATAVVPEDALRDPVAGRRYMDARPVLAGLFESLFLVSAEGVVLADAPHRPNRIGINVSDRQYLRDVRSTRKALISDPIIGRPYGQPQVVFAAPVLDAQGTYLGALLGSVDLLKSDISAGLASEKIGSTGYFFLLAQKPFLTMISHPDKTRIMKPMEARNPLTARALAGWEGSEEVVSTAEGKPGLSSYKRLKSTGWILAARLDSEEAFGPIEAGQVRIALIGLAIAFLFGLLTWGVVTRVLRPLEELHTEIGRGIREAGYQPRPASAQEDELGDLSRDFAKLMAQRAVLNEELLKANASLDERVAQKTGELKKQADEMEFFLHTLGHDLRSPIRAISAYSELVLREQGERLDEDAKAKLTRCIENGRYMGGLIDGMLELGRLSRMKVAGADLVPIDMQRAVDAVLNVLPVPAKTDIRVGTLPAALANARLVSSILHHLIQNAIKFSSRSERPLVEIGGEVRDGEPLYFVRDNGLGFDMRYNDALFKPFSRLHIEDDFPGNGSGLAIAKRSAEILGGRIWAEGAPGRGATFWFVLRPLA